MSPPRRRRRRRDQHPATTVPPPTQPSPPPIEFERKYCEAIADEDDEQCFHQPLCTVLLPMDGPRLCPRHLQECAESCKIYKEASYRMEALQPRVLAFSRRSRGGGFRSLDDVMEAIEVTEEFIFWANRELRERRGHTRFYAFVNATNEPHNQV